MTFISNSLSFCSVLGGRSPSYHQKNMPGTHQYVVTLFPMQMQCLQRMPAPQAAFGVSSPKKMAAQSASIIQIYAESSPSRSLGSIDKQFERSGVPPFATLLHAWFDRETIHVLCTLSLRTDYIIHAKENEKGKHRRCLATGDAPSRHEMLPLFLSLNTTRNFHHSAAHFLW